MSRPFAGQGTPVGAVWPMATKARSKASSNARLSGTITGQAMPDWHRDPGPGPGRFEAQALQSAVISEKGHHLAAGPGCECPSASGACNLIGIGRDLLPGEPGEEGDIGAQPFQRPGQVKGGVAVADDSTFSSRSGNLSPVDIGFRNAEASLDALQVLSRNAQSAVRPGAGGQDDGIEGFCEAPPGP